VDEQTVVAEPDVTEGRVGPLAAGGLAAVGLVWLAATLATSHASVLGNADAPAVALGAMAFALPNVVAATLLAGGSVGLAVTARLSATAAPLRRLAFGLAAGAVLGGVCAGLVVYAYGGTSSITTLAVTVGAGALLGGAAAALPRAVLAAGLVALVGVLLLGLAAGFVQPGLVGLFGGGRTLDSQVSAGWLAAYTVAIAGGVVSGLLAFRMLRGYGPRAWPWYLLAGGLPGVTLLVTEVLTRTGGATLLDAVRSLSEGDQIAVDFSAFARLRNAMVVLFVGGIAAMVAVGRTLQATPDGDAEATESDDEE
jgi:hypothetical protein